MKKFAFPLEDVMKYREYLQNEAELALGKAMAVEHNIEMRIDEVASQYTGLFINSGISRIIDAFASRSSFFIPLYLPAPKKRTHRATEKIIKVK